MWSRFVAADDTMNDWTNTALDISWNNHINTFNNNNSGISRTDGKRPDGMTLAPRSGGKPLTWDVTVACSLAMSYIDAAANDDSSF